MPHKLEDQLKKYVNDSHKKKVTFRVSSMEIAQSKITTEKFFTEYIQSQLGIEAYKNSTLTSHVNHHEYVKEYSAVVHMYSTEDLMQLLQEVYTAGCNTILTDKGI